MRIVWTVGLLVAMVGCSSTKNDSANNDTEPVEEVTQQGDDGVADDGQSAGGGDDQSAGGGDDQSAGGGDDQAAGGGGDDQTAGAGQQTAALATFSCQSQQMPTLCTEFQLAPASIGAKQASCEGDGDTWAAGGCQDVAIFAACTYTNGVVSGLQETTKKFDRGGQLVQADCDTGNGVFSSSDTEEVSFSCVSAAVCTTVTGLAGLATAQQQACEAAGDSWIAGACPAGLEQNFDSCRIETATVLGIANFSVAYNIARTAGFSEDCTQDGGEITVVENFATPQVQSCLYDIPGSFLGCSEVEVSNASDLAVFIQACSQSEAAGVLAATACPTDRPAAICEYGQAAPEGGSVVQSSKLFDYTARTVTASSCGDQGGSFTPVATPLELYSCAVDAGVRGNSSAVCYQHTRAAGLDLRVEERACEDAEGTFAAGGCAPADASTTVCHNAHLPGITVGEHGYDETLTYNAVVGANLCPSAAATKQVASE